jgi:hypothetical protein
MVRIQKQPMCPTLSQWLQKSRQFNMVSYAVTANYNYISIIIMTNVITKYISVQKYQKYP